MTAVPASPEIAPSPGRLEAIAEHKGTMRELGGAR
jgi:hypothetical protein